MWPRNPQSMGLNQSGRQWEWNWLMLYTDCTVLWTNIRWRDTLFLSPPHQAAEINNWRPTEALYSMTDKWMERVWGLPTVMNCGNCHFLSTLNSEFSQKLKYFSFQLTDWPLLLQRHAETHLWALKSCQSRIFMVGRAQTIKIFILIATTFSLSKGN